MSRQEDRASVKGTPGPLRLASKPKAGALRAKDDFWELRLYVAGKSKRADAALANLTTACEAHLQGHYTIDVVDLLLNPGLAQSEQIVALPTLIRRLPAPVKKIIGDLSDSERMLIGLELRESQVPK